MVADAGSSATLVESFGSVGLTGLQRNAVTELKIGEKAALKHFKLQRDGDDALHLSTWLVELGADARYDAFQFSTGASVARNQVYLRFTGEGAAADLSGAFLLRGHQHGDTTLLVEHRVPPGTLKILREFSDPLVARLDPQQFRQAVWNLCLNAVQAMPDGGELRVCASRYDRALEVRVTDTGHGIPPEDLPQVFEPFFSTKEGGTGLGLALAHRVVQDHGGRIELRSAPGAGTTVVVTLPARDE